MERPELKPLRRRQASGQGVLARLGGDQGVNPRQAHPDMPEEPVVASIGRVMTIVAIMGGNLTPGAAGGQLGLGAATASAGAWCVIFGG
jgi:hypothetical protein